MKMTWYGSLYSPIPSLVLSILQLSPQILKPAVTAALNALLAPIQAKFQASKEWQELALKALEEIGSVNDVIRAIVAMREELARRLAALPFVLTVYPSDANFLLVKTTDAHGLYEYLLKTGIVVRDRSKVELCEGCLRVTVGTERENEELLNVLSGFAF